MLFLSCLLVTWAPAANAQGAIQREESAFSTSPDSVTGDDAAQVKVAPPSAKKSIKNELRHESLKRVLSGVTDLKEGKIGNIVSKFSGTETDWVWILREGNLPKDTNAETVPIAGGAITTLDYRKLKGAARLSIARTLIHELVHAYLSLSFRYDALNASKEYPQMIAAWQGSRHPDPNEIHHAEMAVSFVDDIALALKEYGRSLGQDVEYRVNRDLAWGGLNFQSNDHLTEENKARIERLLKAGQYCNLVFQHILADSKTGG